MRRWSFTKGHGTGNDFVLILDREATLEIAPADVAYLCDRHLGLGADGLIRVVLAKHVEGWENSDSLLWFMDYRNADGSLAEMCGNGVRVLVRFLLEHNLAAGPVIPVATRGGLKETTVLPDGRIRVAMGPVSVAEPPLRVTTASGEQFGALTAHVGNPHAVSFTDDLTHLPLHTAPQWDPPSAFTGGVNLEFVRTIGPRHIAMRVFERGVGETQSCGTGTVAAAAAERHRHGDPSPLPVTYQVDVPGGSVEVELRTDQAYLTGPAVLVADGEVTLRSASPMDGQADR
jgi:diaminopimelate epimerase